MRQASTTIPFARALETVPPGDLRAMSRAGKSVLEMQGIAAKTGHNIVGEVLRGEGAFVEWQHYPEDDAYDPESHSQYYYHAHPAAQRFEGEHGHFHLFLRGSGMPDGLAPAGGQELPPTREAILCHLIGISMDAFGQPFRLFTTNRWVTGDVWYSAPDTVSMLDRFRLEAVRPNLAVNRWITAMVQMYRPQIAELLHARDAALAVARRTAPDTEILEDRHLEILSWMDISPEQDLQAIARALRRSGRS